MEQAIIKTYKYRLHSSSCSYISGVIKNFSLSLKEWLPLLYIQLLYFQRFKKEARTLLIYLLTCLLTYLLTSWSRVLFEKLIGFQLVKKFPIFYGNPRFIIALTRTHYPSLFWARSIQSMPPSHYLKIHFKIIHLNQGLLSGLLPSGFPTKTLCTPLLFPIQATCPAHLILLHLITRKIMGEEYRSFSSSLCSLHTPLLPCPSWAQISSSAPYS